MTSHSDTGFGKPPLGEPFLLTPGPLTTAYSVKQAMLRDWGSWDGDFRAMTAQLRAELLALIGDDHDEFDCVPIQGSGTFVVEAMLASFLPHQSKTLVLVNGAYGNRIAETLRYLGRDHIVMDKGDYLPPRAREVAEALAQDAKISHVVVVHCETSSGILNPVEEISKVVYDAGRKLLIANEHGASTGLRESLAKASETTHSRDALKVYAERVEELVGAGGNYNYQEACGLITRMGALRGASQQTAHVADLKMRFRRKRNFMKLLG